MNAVRAVPAGWSSSSSARPRNARSSPQQFPNENRARVAGRTVQRALRFHESLLALAVREPFGCAASAQKRNPPLPTL
jgi:hypothetical protein